MFRRGVAAKILGNLAGMVCLAAGLVIIPGTLRGQQAPATTGAQNGKENANPQDNQDKTTEIEVLPSDQPPLISLDSGQVVTRGISSVHWGRLSLFSLNMSVIRDNVSFGSTNNSITAGVIKGFLLYSFKHGRDEFDFQYMPQITIATYGTSSNLGNQALQFHTFRHLASRWTLNISDSFSYQPNQAYTQDPTVIPQFPTGTILQNPFLTPNQGYLNNLAQGSLSYSRSQKSSYNFSARYGFLRVTSGSTTNAPTPQINSGLNGSDHLVGGGAEWQHNWNPTTALGFSGNYDRRFLSEGGATDYYSLSVNYRRRLTHTVFFSGSIGPTILRETLPASTGSNSDQTLTYEGTFSLTKAFMRSGLALSFDRNHISSPYLQGTLTDRWGLSYSRLFGRRWTSVIGGGYIRQQFTANIGNTAYDGRASWGQVGYELFREWSVTGSYTRFVDTGLLGQAPESRDLFVAGVRWAWAPRDRSGPMPRAPGRSGGPGD
jgi:hypothetical protein